MPIIKSAKKRAKQALVKRDRNYNVRTALRKSVRSVNDSVKAGDKKNAEKNLKIAFKIIDTAAKKNVLHKNTAARKKSSLAKSLTGLAAK